MHISGVNKTYEVGPLEDNAGNIISQGVLMAEDLNGYLSSVFTREDISSLPVPDAKFQEAKSDIGQLTVTPQMVAKQIKAMKDNKSPGVDRIPPKILMETVVLNWKSVLSGVPQGSVLGPLLIVIYINDLYNNITSNVLKFSDDAKVFRKVNTDGDKQHLQNDLTRLVKWPEKWQMLLNFGKCKCLHTGHRNLDGIIISADINFLSSVVLQLQRVIKFLG